jgi:hypothetical protein
LVAGHALNISQLLILFALKAGSWRKVSWQNSVAGLLEIVLLIFQVENRLISCACKRGGVHKPNLRWYIKY